MVWFLWPRSMLTFQPRNFWHIPKRIRRSEFGGGPKEGSHGQSRRLDLLWTQPQLPLPWTKENNLWPGTLRRIYMSLFVKLKDESNKIAQTFWHQFSFQFSMLFHIIVCSILLSVLRFKTNHLVDPDWLLKISKPISNTVLRYNTVQNWASKRALKTDQTSHMRS